MNQPIAEIVESSTGVIQALCTRRGEKPPLPEPPPFGSLVKMEGPVETIGVVSCITSTGPDPARHPMALDLSSLKEVYEEYPELSDLVLTRIQIIPVGYKEGVLYHQGTPPSPPPLHGGVKLFNKDLWPQFLKQFYFLRLLFENSGSEELLVQTLRIILRETQDENLKRIWLLEMGRQLVRIITEFDRLRYILQRIEKNE